MDLSNPLLANAEPIKRLAPYVVLYVSLLVVLRMFVWPTFLRIRERSTLDVLLRRLLRRFLLLVSALGLAFLAFLSLLSITGEDVTFDFALPTDLFETRAIEVPPLADVVPALDGYMAALLGIVFLLIVIFALFRPWR